MARKGSGKPASGADSAPSTPDPCPACGGRGVQAFATDEVPCGVCRGTGEAPKED